MKDGYYRIKTWDRMEEEYGIDKDGDIDCLSVFTAGMERHMPKDRIIQVIGCEWNEWIISEDMFAEYLGPEKLMSKERKPCPFCGSDYNYLQLDQWPVPKIPDYYISCQQCGTYGPWGKTKEQAIEFWNDRKEGGDDE